MKQTRLQFLLALLMTAATGAWAQQKLTVYDGTDRETTSPASIVYCDEYARSQTIIPSTALTAMKGCDITAMTFYSGTNISFTTECSFDVYLKEVSYSAFTDPYTFEPQSSCTTVYQGTLSVVNGTLTLTVTFSKPFHYNGGNLLIGTENKSKNSIYYYIEFQGTNTNQGYTNISVYHSTNLASASIAKSSFIPKTTFTYVVPTYTVNLNDGELNPTTWKAKVGDATEFGKLPLENVTEGQTVTLSYSGTGEVKRIRAITGALTGKFTVNEAGKKVVFSQGNLQAVCTSADENGDTQEAWTWRFAPNQWDCVGGADYNDGWIGTLTGNNHINGNGSTSATGIVDLFGWVGDKNTDWTGAAMYGVTNDQNANHYGNVHPDVLKSDWGKTMGDGWFTMTVDEWIYLLSGRTDAAQKYGYGSIGGVNGLILLPDSWTLPEGLDFTAGTLAWNGTNSYTTDEWAKMEAAGAVFLPAAGDRYHGNKVQAVGSVGFYMSSTSAGQLASYKMLFEENNLNANASYTRNNGYSVRLVRQTK